MFAIEISALLTLGGLVATASLIWSTRTALPQVAAIRRALEHCTDRQEMRFTLREVMVSYNDGKIVPLRRRAAVSPRCQIPARVAA